MFLMILKFKNIFTTKHYFFYCKEQMTMGFTRFLMIISMDDRNTVKRQKDQE